MNVKTLNEMVQDLVAPVEMTTLHEGFFEKWFSGTDDEQLDRIRDRLHMGFRSEDEKRRTLDAIDDLIDHSNRILNDADLSTYLTSVGAAILTAGVANMIKLVHRLTNDRDRASFRNALHDMRAEVAKAPIKK